MHYLRTSPVKSMWKHVKTMWTEFTMWNILWNKNIFLVQKMIKNSILWKMLWKFLKCDLRSIMWNSRSPCEMPSKMLVVNLINFTIPCETSVNHVKTQSTLWNRSQQCETYLHDRSTNFVELEVNVPRTIGILCNA